MNAIDPPSAPATPIKEMGSSEEAKKNPFKAMGLAAWKFLEEEGQRRAARELKRGDHKLKL